MCVPLLPALALGASAIGAGLSAYGQMTQAQAAANAANYNAKVSGYQADAVEQQAGVNAQQVYRQGDQLEGRARAALAANGVDPNSGSALSVQTDIGKQTGLNVADTQYNADLQAWGFRNQAGLQTAQAQANLTAGGIGATASLLGGASQVGSQWAVFKSSGLLDPSGSSWGNGPNINWAATNNGGWGVTA